MRYAGIDIGSRTIELVVVDETGELFRSRQTDTGFDPMTEARNPIDGVEWDGIMATGYGRNLFEISFDAPTVTEIMARARGLHSSVIRRTAGMINRVSPDGDIVFTGGVPNIEGNYYARRKFMLLKNLLEFMGMAPGRLHFSWISSAESTKYVKVVNQVVAAVKELGPSDFMNNASGDTDLAVSIRG